MAALRMGKPMKANLTRVDVFVAPRGPLMVMESKIYAHCLLKRTY